MTSQLRNYSFEGLDLPEVPLQESVAMATVTVYNQIFAF